MESFKIKNQTFIYGDSLEYIKGLRDNEYDLVLCDSPYGIGMSKPAGLSQKYSKEILVDREYDDDSPDQEFFNQIFRVSKNQVIFGFNHFMQKINKPSSCILVWDKRMGVVPPRTFADCELAWTSFDKPARVFRFLYDGFLVHGKKEARYHPNQKPSELYEWILMNYAKKGDKILDPFGGSFSSSRAAYDLGFEMTSIEIDKEFHDKGVKRFKEYITQLKMF